MAETIYRVEVARFTSEGRWLRWDAICSTTVEDDAWNIYNRHGGRNNPEARIDWTPEA